MTSEQIKALDAEYMAQTYARFDLCLEDGRGCRARDPEGKTYLDFTSGIGVNSLGWADPAWAAAVAHQASTLQHTSNLYHTGPAAQLAAALCQRSGMARVFFANSGAEANEGAIKAARKYSLDKYGQGRNTIVALQNAFHGRTMAALSATGQPQYHQHFHPFVQGFAHVPAGDINALREALSGDVCAVIFEPIQGEGGVIPLPQDYLLAMQALCREKDILLIADEVQTGVGRTGSFLATQKYGVSPDIVTLAKGLGGGLPIGAVLFAHSTAAVLGHGHHGATYGGNPVCCAGALAVMDRLSEAFLADVAKKGTYLKAQLATLPGVQAVNGDGLMLGVVLAPPLNAAQILNAAMEKGMLILLAKENLRFLPPLTITTEELDEGLAILEAVLKEMTA